MFNLGFDLLIFYDDHINIGREHYYLHEIYRFLISSNILHPDPFMRPNAETAYKLYSDFFKSITRSASV